MSLSSDQEAKISIRRGQIIPKLPAAGTDRAILGLKGNISLKTSPKIGQNPVSFENENSALFPAYLSPTEGPRGR